MNKTFFTVILVLMSDTWQRPYTSKDLARDHLSTHMEELYHSRIIDIPVESLLQTVQGRLSGCGPSRVQIHETFCDLFREGILSLVWLDGELRVFWNPENQRKDKSEMLKNRINFVKQNLVSYWRNRSKKIIPNRDDDARKIKRALEWFYPTDREFDAAWEDALLVLI